MTSETKVRIVGMALIACGWIIITLCAVNACDDKGRDDESAAKIDSLRRENEDLRSEALEMRERINIKEHEVDSLKSRKGDIIVRYKTLREEITDTAFVYIADSLNEVNNQIIDTLEDELDDCKHIVSIQDEILRNDSVSLVVCEDIVRTQRVKIAKLERGWWDRNKFWVGLASGLVVGGAGAIAVMK